MADAHLVEIFSSVQGEGVHVGRSTVFVRFGGCDLRCAWCDSPLTWKPATSGEVTKLDGSRVGFANPVAIPQLLGWLADYRLEQHAFVSLTGGEPLLQPDALGELARALSGAGPRRFLETHGLEADALEQVIEDVDVVSMDWKLASDVRRAGVSRAEAREEFHQRHAEFLRVARAAPEVVVKVVVTPATEIRELDAMIEGIAGVDPSVPVILQPVTPTGGVRAAPDPAQVLAWHRHLERGLRDVRLIPQTHKILQLA